MAKQAVVMRRMRGVVWAVIVCAAGALGVTGRASAQLPDVPVPPQNPITESKRVLGKVLFWDEQLSSNNVVSCGTCHMPRRGGTDNRAVRNPGPDGVLNTPDDILGSPGVIRMDVNNEFLPDAVFGLREQITGRSANSMINAAFAPELFWDGRASGTFVDPQTGLTVIPAGGALESQAVGPPLSEVEMAHAGYDWNDITAKLARVQPMDLGTNLTPDMTAALAGNPGYPELFRRAFGDTAITAARVAMAMATYQRTLISDQTPYDRFLAGDTAALTPGQLQGLNVFRGGAARCTECHVEPMLTDHTFRNIGLRPPAEDPGRQNVTNDFNDRGKFKVPELRNGGLKRTFFHNGQGANMGAVVNFYAQTAGSLPIFPDNLDEAMLNIAIPQQARTVLVDFLVNGLTDPRVANEQFPFDRPILFFERPENQASFIGVGVPGANNFVPRVVAPEPAMVGNMEFKIGLDAALGGATARLAMSTMPPINDRITPERYLGQLTVNGIGAGLGYATVKWPIRPGLLAGGQDIYVQWFVDDSAAVGGVAISAVARIPVFCGNSGCPCPADFTGDRIADINDFFAYLSAFSANDPRADVDGSGAIDINDFFVFLNQFSQGC